MMAAFAGLVVWFIFVFDDDFLFSIALSVAVSVSLFRFGVGLVRFGIAKVRTFFCFPNFYFFIFGTPLFLVSLLLSKFLFPVLRDAKV
jgi:hypothetical protein